MVAEGGRFLGGADHFVKSIIVLLTITTGRGGVLAMWFWALCSELPSVTLKGRPRGRLTYIHKTVLVKYYCCARH